MKFNVITIFPRMITDYTNESILGRGQKGGAISVNAIDLRGYAEDKHKTVDDTPYGGGAGMVLKPGPIYKALEGVDALKGSKDLKKHRTILLSPRGRQFDQRVAEEWRELDEITFVCGRYEGVDQRVVDHMVDEEVSIGPYVLAGGELGALVMIEAVSRLVPGVLGNAESIVEETHSLRSSVVSLQSEENESLKSEDRQTEVQKEYPQYTKPSEFNGWGVPEILLSGDHKKIEEWRRDNSK